MIKDRDGRPALRDPTFLAETQICVKANVDRLMKPEGTMAGATQTVRLQDHDVPVTVYSEGAAMGKHGDTFYVSCPDGNAAADSAFAEL